MKLHSIASLAAFLATTMVVAVPLPDDVALAPAVLGYKRSTDEGSDLGYKREANPETAQVAVEGMTDVAEALAQPKSISKRHCKNPKK